jgi:DNA-binding NarL/FixJ family response regulator
MNMHILIADDHPIFRSGLKFLLESSFPGAAVTDFDNGAQVLDYLESHHPRARHLCGNLAAFPDGARRDPVDV